MAGRPQKPIEDDKLKALCRLKPTIEDCATFFDVHEDTIRRHIKKYHKSDFASFRNKYMVETRMMLIRTALQQAKNGNTAMLIFCLKNICKWTDRTEISGDSSPITVSLKYADKVKLKNK